MAIRPIERKVIDKLHRVANAHPGKKDAIYRFVESILDGEYKESIEVARADVSALLSEGLPGNDR